MYAKAGAVQQNSEIPSKNFCFSVIEVIERLLFGLN